jgi:hypothetical protein
MCIVQKHGSTKKKKKAAGDGLVVVLLVGGRKLSGSPTTWSHMFGCTQTPDTLYYIILYYCHIYLVTGVGSVTYTTRDQASHMTGGLAPRSWLSPRQVLQNLKVSPRMIPSTSQMPPQTQYPLISPPRSLPPGECLPGPKEQRVSL